MTEPKLRAGRGGGAPRSPLSGLEETPSPPAGPEWSGCRQKPTRWPLYRLGHSTGRGACPAQTTLEVRQSWVRQQPALLGTNRLARARL